MSSEKLDLAALRHGIRQFKEQFEPKDPVHLAEYVSDNGDGYHYVDMLSSDGTQVLGRRKVRGNVIAYAGVIVRVSKDRKRFGDELAIIDVDANSYETSEPPSMLKNHGETHGHGEPDQIGNLHTWQLWPLRVEPHSGLTVRVLQGMYYAESAYHQLTTRKTVDLTSYVPGDSGDQVYVTLSIDGEGEINVTEGTERSGQPAPEDVALAPAGEQALGAVRLVNGDSSLAQDRFYADLRYLGGGASAGAGAAPDYQNTFIVDKGSSGDYEKIQSAVDAASAEDSVIVYTAAYGENLTLDVNDFTLIGVGGSHRRQGSSGPRITGLNDGGPILTNAQDSTVQELLFLRDLTSGSAEFVAIDASDDTYTFQLIDCRVDITDTDVSRDVTCVAIAGTASATSVISRCYLAARGDGANQHAVELEGNDVVIEDSDLTGDVVVNTATALYLKNVRVDGDITGVAGSDLYVDGGLWCSGSISGWDSVSYRDETMADHVADSDPHTGYLLETGASVGATSQTQQFTNDVEVTAGDLLVASGYDLQINSYPVSFGRVVSMLQCLPGVIAIWPLGACKRTGWTDAFLDVSGNGYHLSGNGTRPVINVDGLAPYVDLDQANTEYLSRADGGADDWADVQGDENIMANALRGLTLIIWTYFDSESTGDATTVMGKISGADQRSYLLHKSSADAFQFQVSSDGEALTTVSSTESYATASWINMIGAWDPSATLSIMINGEEDTNTDSIPATIFDSTADFCLGARSGGASPFDGRLSLACLCGSFLPLAVRQQVFYFSRSLYGV